MKAARVISYIMVPPVLTLAVFIYLAVIYNKQTDTFTIDIINPVLFGFLLPVITFIIMRKKGKIVNDDATVKEERTVPYIIGVIFCLSAFSVSYISGSHKIIGLMWIVLAVCSVLIIIINYYWKISAHMLGAAIPFSCVYFTAGLKALVFLPFLILLGWARWKLGVHTISQIIAGTLLGGSITLFVLYCF
ncbi:MAG: hypothetical protein GXX85_08570 [Ignavibacteria bacterium]|nr:hypothetical protein [Ignavibacteria bacterium]